MKKIKAAQQTEKPRGRPKERKANTQWRILCDRMDLLQRILSFRQFLGSGFDPEICDSEIVVMFADVRGFTEYCRTLQKEMQDRKIQNFLRTYVRIFNEGLLQWIVEKTDKRFGRIDGDALKLVNDIVPSMYKNLGDGMMMTWEIPSDMDLDSQGLLTQEIAMLADNFLDRFNYHFRNLSPTELDSYSQEVEKLCLGFGMAKGHAWRLDFGHSRDYAGSIINLASRLEAYARPQGVVSMYDVSPWFFDRLTKEKSGQIGRITNIKGYDPVKVHVSAGVDIKQIEGFQKGK